MKLYKMSTSKMYYLWNGKEWLVGDGITGGFRRSAHGSDFDGPFEDGLKLVANNYRQK